MNLEAVKNSLKRGVVSSVYLLYGTETYLRDELVNKFIEVLLPKDVRDFNLDLIDGKEKGLTEIVSLAQNLPFIAEKRLLIVKDAPYFKAKKKATKIEENETATSTDDIDFLKYLESPNPSTVIIFLADEGIDKRKKIFNAIGKRGQVVEFFSLQGRELREWIEGIARSQGKKIEKEAVERLLQNLGSNLQHLKTELDKLITYVGRRDSVRVDDVDLLVAKKTDYNIFQVIDEVGLKNYTEAIKIIRDMIFLGEQPLKILQMIAKQYRVMLQMKDLLALGYSEKQIAEITAVHPYVVKKTIVSSLNFKAEELEGFIIKTKEIDYKIKTGQLEANLAIELYLLGA